MNGMVEEMNKHQKDPAKYDRNIQDWHKKLQSALLSNRTSIRSSNWATPYSLVYRMEAA